MDLPLPLYAVPVLPILAAVYCTVQWLRYGRDPLGKELVLTRFSIPDELSPAEAGLLLDDGLHSKEIVGEIFLLALRDHLRLSPVGNNDAIFTRNSTNVPLQKYQKRIFAQLFRGKTSVRLSELQGRFAHTLPHLQRMVGGTLARKHYYVRNPYKTMQNYLFMAFAVLFLGGWFLLTVSDGYEISDGMMLVQVGSLALTAVILAFFGKLMMRRTKKGSLTKEHLQGFRDYLQVAEQDRMAFHHPVTEQLTTIDPFLPYAIAMGVDTQWTKHLEILFKR